MVPASKFARPGIEALPIGESGAKRDGPALETA